MKSKKHEIEYDEIFEEDKKTIEDYEKKEKKDRRDKIILIIIIIILLLLHFLCCKIGKIGYKDGISTSTTPDGSNNSENSNEITNNIDSEYKDAIIDVIEVANGDIKNIKGAELDIFKNEKFGGRKIIAPGSKGIYKFCVKNVTDNNITYDISFFDKMTNPINMKYKLKIDNIYIRGNQEKYVNIKNLNVDDVIVVKDSINVFTLEWYWEDSDKADTFVGSQKENQYYTLDLNIAAEVYEEK